MAVPGTPSRHSEEVIDDTRIVTFFWVDDEADATHANFRYREAGTTVWTEVLNVDEYWDWTYHIFTGLEPDTRYEVQCSTCNADGCSDWSSSLFETTLLSPVSNPEASTSGDDVVITWDGGT